MNSPRYSPDHSAWILLLSTTILCCGETPSDVQDDPPDEEDFPVQASVLVSGFFGRCEGITFNGEGHLYVAGDAALWRIDTSGTVTHVTDAYSNLGLAPVGARDILFADFGPTNAFDHGPNRDGMVWRVTPEGDRQLAADGMGDPNFVLMLANGSFLVSDDATDEIFIVAGDGSVEIFTQQVNHPNGLALSADGARLFIAQMFTSIDPISFDGRLWVLELDGASQPVGEPQVLVDLGSSAANDGLALDVLGRVYVAAWGTGQIWRIDPDTNERVLIARNLPGVASLAFGRGQFDHQAIYATSTTTGNVWVIPVGVEGAALNR